MVLIYLLNNLLILIMLKSDIRGQTTILLGLFIFQNPIFMENLPISFYKSVVPKKSLQC